MVKKERQKIFIHVYVKLYVLNKYYFIFYSLLYIISIELLYIISVNIYTIIGNQVTLTIPQLNTLIDILKYTIYNYM